MYKAQRVAGGEEPIGKDNPERLQVAYFTIPPELGPYVTRIYHFRLNEQQVVDVQPAALGQLTFLLEGEGYLEFADGHRDPGRPATLYGPGTAAIKVHFNGPLEHFGCALSPLGFVAITGSPANRYADRAVSASERLGPGADALAAKFRERRQAGPLDYQLMVGDLTELLMSRARRVPPAHIALIDTVLQWLLSGFDPDVEELYAQLPMSRSTASRLITRYYGSPPKPLMRKYRALRAASLLIDTDTPPEMRSQVESLFYDQPHMIREFRQFTGRTPGALHTEDIGVLRWWLAKGNNKLPDPKPG